MERHDFSCEESRAGHRRTSLARLPALVAMLGALAGCTTDGQGPFALASGGGHTVTFESIDGPPPPVFDRLVRVLDAESQTRSLAIVSREAPAAYRVRTYLSAQVRRGRTTIAWVWDVYDRNQQRAVRLSGEEPGGRAGRDAWSSADDQLLRRIAQAGLNGISGLVNGTAAPAEAQPSPATPTLRGPSVASARGFGTGPLAGSDAMAFGAR